MKAFALRRHEHHDPELAALVHRGEHMNRAQQRLIDLITELLGEAAAVGLVRSDVAPAELAVYCVHAIAASSPDVSSVQRAHVFCGDTARRPVTLVGCGSSNRS